MTKFQAPSDDLISEALRKTPTVQLRRAFFEGLQNPLWVESLAKAGAFKNPPEPEKLPDGLIRDVYWPEIDYLVRVASQAPAAVVNVLLQLQASNNAWVRRGVFTIGATIPADEAARLEPLIRSWTSSGFGWRTDPRDVIRFAINLLSGEQYKRGKRFADLIFRPIQGDARKFDPTLEDYWYEQGIPQVVAALRDDGLPLVLSWLEALQRKRGRLGPDLDLTFVSRESIRAREESVQSVEQELIDAVRDLAVKAMRTDAERARRSLLGSKMLLARKIALFAASEALAQPSDDEESMKRTLRVAIELLLDPMSIDDACRIEYGELSRTVSGHSHEAVESLAELLEPILRADDDNTKRWIHWDDTGDETLDDRVNEYQEWRLHRWLSAIGAEALPAHLQTRLASLDARQGVVESPLEPANHITTWTGPNSPITQDEMSVMSPAELVDHLESWHALGDGWGPEPSHEGQGRELTALLTTNPSAVAGVSDLVNRLRPTYLRAILQGWEAALKASLELDWGQVSDLLRGVLTHGDPSVFPNEGDAFDDDVDFRLAKKAVVGLLGELVKTRNESVPIETKSRFAELLIRDADDETAWTTYSSHFHGDGTDPLTISLNWQWPMRIRGLIYLMAHGRDAGWYDAARSALERELSRDDAHGAGWAVVGEGLGRLINVDPDWVRANVARWFGDGDLAANQQIALTTAMAVHYYHPTLYDLLTLSMVALLKAGHPVVVGWRSHYDPIQRVGEWVVNALMRGHKTLDDPVATVFFTSVPAKVRGAAIGQIAWSFMHAEAVDITLRDGLAKLWDARVKHVRSQPDDHEELSDFFWFVRSGKFAVSWWLPRLKEAAELYPGLSREKYIIGKQLASAADVDARTALDVLKLLLTGRDEADLPSFDLTRHAVPMILARGIASGDDQLKADAEAYMHLLGEQGNLQLQAEVNAVLDGTIDQDDVGES
jgi:hypothetical protein